MLTQQLILYDPQRYPLCAFRPVAGWKSSESSDTICHGEVPLAFHRKALHDNR